MELNRATDYAFRAVLYLSKLPRGQVVEAKVIAEEEKIPIRFLLKIFRFLTQAGIVESFRGVNGGYTLTQSPRDITLKDVLEAVEGPIYINRCLIAPEECNKRHAVRCSIHKALHSVQQTLNKELESYNFETLSNQK